MTSTSSGFHFYGQVWLFSRRYLAELERSSEEKESSAKLLADFSDDLMDFVRRLDTKFSSPNFQRAVSGELDVDRSDQILVGKRLT